LTDQREGNINKKPHTKGLLTRPISERNFTFYRIKFIVCLVNLEA